jgi:hypothetical protein
MVQLWIFSNGFCTQIWEARVRHVDPRYAKRNGPLLDLTSCRDWQRTLEWVGDSSSVTNGCTMQTLASSSVIAIAMPAVELKNSVKREKLVGFASANIVSVTIFD